MKLAFVASLVVVLAAQPLMIQSVAAQDPTRVLKVIPSSDVSELDPTRGANLVSRIYSQMVFDTLFALDRDLAPQPMMVDHENVSQDGLTYTFTLRSGLKFHDGSPVTTRDVVASLDRWMGGTSIGGQLKARTMSMNIVDDFTFALVLKQRFGLVEFMLAGPGAPIAAIMPEADAKRDASVALTNPIGSGPFRYVADERVSGHRTVFVRNSEYPARSEPTNGLAGARVVKVDRVEWTVVPDPTTAANALVTGEADFWEAVTPDLVPFLHGRDVTVRRTYALPSVAFVRPNFALPPFNDVRARQALALLFDQNDFMEAVAGDNAHWEKCYSFSVCGVPFGTEAGSEAYHKPDVARAKQLLIESGYRGEKLVLLGTPTLPPINAMTQVAAQRLKEAGVNVDVQMTDFPTMFQRANARGKPLDAGGYNLFTYYAVGSSWFHPLMNVSVDLSCNPGWAGFPCDPDGEVLRQSFLSAPDDAGRKVAFAAFQKHLWDFMPYIPVGQFDVASAYRKNVTGVLDAYFIAYWNIKKQ